MFADSFIDVILEMLCPRRGFNRDLHLEINNWHCQWFWWQIFLD